MLSKLAANYLSLRRRAGYRLSREGHWLGQFVAYSKERGEVELLRAHLVVEWATRRGQTRGGRARRLKVLIVFARHAKTEDKRHEVPEEVFGPVPLARRRTAFFFSREDLNTLVVGTLHHVRSQGTLRPHTYATLFALLGVTGMRVSEALNLRLDDLTEDGLVVRDTKFGKSRLVVLHPTTRAGLLEYLERRRSESKLWECEFLFVSLVGKRVILNSVEFEFRRIVRLLGFDKRPGMPRPRIHDLRHSYAIRALEACAATGDRECIGQHTLALFTYLGHQSLKTSYWYLSATLPTLREIARVSEDFVRGGGR